MSAARGGGSQAAFPLRPSFFALLSKLNVGDAKVLLGMVNHTDGIVEFRARRDLARAQLHSFGIGSVCGYGRVQPGLLPEILRTHAADAAEL
ncbi:MAG TPA: hypothetical protein VID68_08855 [Solirubrobacteraceae bacterium]